MPNSLRAVDSPSKALAGQCEGSQDEVTAPRQPLRHAPQVRQHVLRALQLDTQSSQNTSAGMFPCKDEPGARLTSQTGNHGTSSAPRSPRAAAPGLTSIHRPDRLQSIQLAARTSASCKPTEG